MKCVLNKYLISSLLFALFLPVCIKAEIYSYVDKNGKTQYTNMAPPRSAKAISKTKEITVTGTELQERIEQKRVETDESYEVRKEQIREAARISAEKKAERNRVALQNEVEKKEKKRKIRNETKYMLSKEKIWLSKCKDMKKGYLIVEKCRKQVKKRTKRDLRFLRKSTRSYFIHKFSNRGDTDRYFEKMYDSLLEKY